MKTELIYLWIEKDTHECFHNMGFNFSSCYDVAYDSKQHELQIDKKESINVFREDNIQFVWIIGIPIMIGVMAIADTFVPVFYGRGYDKIKVLLPIYSLSVIPVALSNVTAASF